MRKLIGSLCVSLGPLLVQAQTDSADNRFKLTGTIIITMFN
ncbi:hypothetical protein [Terrimonas sp.]|nr:hypothetical protein [Terrimonas sp.]